MRRLLAAAVLAAVAAGMPGGPEAWGASGDFRITDERVTESSGLALSHRHPHTVWTVNDSGDSARIFGVDTRTGRTVALHTFDAPVRDVEALAVTPGGTVLVGDIGDNTASREQVRVFWFDEPGLGTTSGGWASWELVYPDGPHDAESLAVDPATGRVVVVTKGRDGAVYALPEEPSRQGRNRLARVASAPAGATDAVYLHDGSALAVRTYTRLYLLDPRSWSVTATRILPLQPQGETLALAPDGRSLLAGSEGRRSLVHRVDLPAPHGAGTPTTVPTGTPSATSPPASRARSAPVESRVAPLGARPWWLAASVVGGGLLAFLWRSRRKGRAR